MKRNSKYVVLDVHQAMTAVTVRWEGGRVIMRSVLEAGGRSRPPVSTTLRTVGPIPTHTPPEARIGEKQGSILKEEGVEPHHIYMGHINHTLDPEYHRELGRLGVWLGWDVNNPLGRPHLPPWPERISGCSGPAASSTPWPCGSSS